MAHFPAPPLPPPDADRSGDLPYESPSPTSWAVPTTLYVWLLMLVLSVAVPRIQESGGEKPKNVLASAASDRRAAGVTSPDFEKYLTAELSVKAAFGMQGLETFRESVGGKSRTKNSSAELLQKGVTNYRALLQTNPSPNLARRVLLLEHVQRKPLDEKILTGPLSAALTRAAVSPTEQAAERTLWRGIYGDGSQTETFVPDGEKRIKAMNLRFFENRVLADLYQAAGQKKRAQAAEGAFRDKATGFAVRMGMVNGAGGLAMLAGVCFLIVFLVAASTKNWLLVRRVATQSQPLGWGDYLDGFVFYLMLVFAARPVVGLIAPHLFSNPSTQTVLLAAALTQAMTALTAAAYMGRTLRRRGATWSAMGFRAPGGLLANVGYGIAGYCASLPISIGLKLLSNVLFRGNPNTTPNSILPLMTSQHDLGGRLIIFGMASLAAPLFEELFFRGVLFSGLRTRFGWVVSGLISGTCFALVHPMQDWLPIFGLGFTFAALREMRQSLVPGIVGHFCQNTVTFVMLSVLFGD